MNDLVVGLGLVFVFEGLLWALAPDFGKRMMAELSATPETALRTVAWAMVGIGLGLVWLVRG